MGCLRTSARDAGSDFVRPTLTLSQEPRMLFQNEHFNFLSLGARERDIHRHGRIVSDRHGYPLVAIIYRFRIGVLTHQVDQLR